MKLRKQRNLQKSYFKKFGMETLKIPPKFVESVFAELNSWNTTILKFIAISALSEDHKERFQAIVEARLRTL